MMNCHLIEQAKAGQLTADAIQEAVERVESVVESNTFDVDIVKCRTCGQTFVYGFKQYTSPDWEDDYWTFWIPIGEQEVATIREAKSHLELMGEMVHERPHICWHPDGHVFWAKQGLPVAFIVFMS